MDVLHVTDSYLPRVGGIELHLRDLVTNQRARGLDVRILTAAPGSGREPHDPAWVLRASAGTRHLASTAAAGAARRVLLDHRPEVLHAHISLFSPFAALTIRAAVDLGVPTLVTAHSMWDGLGPLPWLAGGALGVRRWPVAWTAVSQRAATSLADLLGPDVPVHVLPNAVDLGQWRAPLGGREAAPAVAEPPTVVSVMRLTRVKRALPLVGVLREVHEQVPAVRALVIGDGPQRRPVQRYLHHHAMDGWVDLPGRLDRGEIRHRLHGAAVFVAPADRETFGIAPLEARALGLPVVGRSRSGVGEYITHGVEGLLADDDAEMCDQVVRLLVDRELRERICAHNRRVAPRHDWDHACSAAHDLYVVATEATRHARHPVDLGAASPLSRGRA